MKQLIKKLVEATGPSGYEAEVRNIIREEISAVADEIDVDPLGNLIAKKGKKRDGGKRIMVASHMDEIGVMATHIDDNGFVRFTGIGGVYLSTLFGGRVKFTNGTHGVIGYETPSFGKNLPEMSKFFIDVGAKNREDCPVRPGDAAAFYRTFEDMGDRLAAKAMDDRIAVAISIEAMKQLGETPNEIFFVFTVQEEVGLRGAQTSAVGIDPEIGLAVDITDSFDTPNDHKIDIRMGRGPAIKVKDDYLVVDPRIVDWMEQAATRIGIPHQFEVLPFGGTDAGAISLIRGGVPSGCISIPTRYAHSPSEVLDYNDVTNAVKLLVELISKPVELSER